MKFNTPRCPRLFRGFPLLEKGGVFVRRGATQKAGLGLFAVLPRVGIVTVWLRPESPLRASLAHGNLFAVVTVIDHAA